MSISRGNGCWHKNGCYRCRPERHPLSDHAQAHEGQTVVIHGSAGNVDSYAVQLARLEAAVVGTIFGGDRGYC